MVGTKACNILPDMYFNTVFRPQEDGRSALMTTDFEKSQGVAREIGLLDVRTRVYEYGGAPATVEGDMLYFVNSGDQRVYVLNIGK